MEEEQEYAAMVEYGQKVLDHFINPRNVGKIESPDVEVTVGDPACGDFIKLYLRVESGRIAEIKFLVQGCVGAISTSSALTELAKGKALSQAMEITDDDVIEYLGGIPERKKHCSLLGVRALRTAVESYTQQREVS